MTTATAEVSKEPTPGTIVWVPGLFESDDSHFGVVTPINYWDRDASPRAKRLFSEGRISFRYPVPILIMDNNFSWSLHFAYLSGLFVHGNLFDTEEAFNHQMKLFNSFTHRDGSRYYAEFYRRINLFQKFLPKSPEEIYEQPYFSRGKNWTERNFILFLKEWNKHFGAQH